MACLTNILWAPMADLTVSAVMAGLTTVLWAPMAGPTFSCGRRMAGPTFSCGHQWLASQRFPHPTQSIVPSVGAKWLTPSSPLGADGWPH